MFTDASDMGPPHSRASLLSIQLLQSPFAKACSAGSPTLDVNEVEHETNTERTDENNDHDNDSELKWLGAQLSPLGATSRVV